MKDKLPAMMFYPGDWLKAPELRVVSHAARGLWIDLLCFMFENEQRGVLPHSSVLAIARMTGGTVDETKAELEELESAGVFSRNESGHIICRRMLRDETKRHEMHDIKAQCGRQGGNPAFEKGKPNPYYQNDNEADKEKDKQTDKQTDKRKITLSSSSSSSSSISITSSEEERESSASPPTPAQDSIDVELSELLIAKIEEINPTYFDSKPPNMKRWTTAFRLIRTQDKRDIADIRFVIENFGRHRDGAFSWADNIRAPDALRGTTRSGADKFTTIITQLRTCNGTTHKSTGRDHVPTQAEYEQRKQMLGIN